MLAATAGALASAAPAGAQWQPPETVSPPTAFIFSPQIGFDGRGFPLAAWDAHAGRRTFADPTGGPGVESSRWGVRSGDRWRLGRTSRRLPTIIPYGRLRALAVYRVGPRPYLYAAWIDLRRNRIWRTQRLDRESDRIDAIALDVNRGGYAVIAWSAVDRGRHSIRMAEARGGRPKFGRARRVSSLSGVSPRVDVHERGDAVVAWERNGLIEARVRRGHGRFSAVKRVGTNDNAVNLAAAAGPGGRAAVAWSTQNLCCGDGGGPTTSATLRLAYASPVGRFRPPTAVDEFPRVRRGSPQVVFDAIGGGQLAWTTDSDGAVRAAHFNGTNVSRPQTLAQSTAPADGVELIRLAAVPSGGSVVAWLRGDLAFTTAPTTLMAAQTPGAGNPYAGAEQVAPADHDVQYADMAVDPRGRPAAVWSRELGGANGRVLEYSQRR